MERKIIELWGGLRIERIQLLDFECATANGGIQGANDATTLHHHGLGDEVQLVNRVLGRMCSPFWPTEGGFTVLICFNGNWGDTEYVDVATWLTWGGDLGNWTETWVVYCMQGSSRHDFHLTQPVTHAILKWIIPYTYIYMLQYC